MTDADWQPIETAPKDGRRILIYADIFPGIVVAHWQERNITGEGWVMDPESESWGAHDAKPTHWMPLPEPPHDER